MSYDAKCAELAAHFLSDFQVEDEELKLRTDRLAQDIQDAIESYIQDAELKERSSRCRARGHVWVGIGDDGKVVCDDCGIEKPSAP